RALATHVEAGHLNNSKRSLGNASSRLRADFGQVFERGGYLSPSSISAFARKGCSRSRMPNSNQHATEHQRLDFVKIQRSIQIPNLIEVQMKSYQRFRQMDLLPSEREDGGLQSVFTSVFPIKDFREMSQLEFVDYSIGNWECKCGNLKGLH